MPNVGITKLTLDDGRELTLDLHRVTIKEFRFATANDTEIDKSDEIVAKCVGLTLDEIQALSQPDYRGLVAAFWKAATQPIGEKDSEAKNSPSESTSD